MSNRRLALIIIALAILLFNIEYSGIPVIIPAISSALSLTVSQIQWLATGYLLAFFSLIIAAGHLGDLHSQSRMFMVGIVIFMLGSAIGGLAISGWQVLLGRVIQGIGAATVYPNMTAMAFAGTNSVEKSRVAGIVASIVGITIAIGPPLAGFITAYLSWRSFFLINVPVGIVLMILMIYYLRHDSRVKTQPPARHHFDFLGAMMLVICLCALIYGLEQFKGGLHHWQLGFIVIVFALVAALVFVKIEGRARQPIIALSFLTNRCLVMHCLVRWTTNFSFYVLFFILGLYFHLVLGYSVLVSGFIFLPLSLTIGLVSPIGGKMVARFGQMPSAMTGILAFIIVFLGFFLTAKQHVLWFDMILLALAGFAYGLISPALLSVVMAAVPAEQSGLASGAFYMMSLFGSTVGVTITGMLFYALHQATIEQTIAYCFPIVMLICCAVILLGGILLMCYQHGQSQP